MIRALINLYILLLILNTILSYLPQFRNQAWAYNIRRAADVTCKPVRKYLPPDLPLDPSPFIVIIILKLIEALW